MKLQHSEVRTVVVEGEEETDADSVEAVQFCPSNPAWIATAGTDGSASGNYYSGGGGGGGGGFGATLANGFGGTGGAGGAGGFGGTNASLVFKRYSAAS